MPLIYTVPQSHCVILERFGRFSRIQYDGLQFRIPIFEQIRQVTSWGNSANKRGFMIELTEQQTDTPPRMTHTKDNVPVTANASVYWRITDPRRALYEVDILPKAIADVALNALRSNIGTIELDSVLSERQQLNQRIESQLVDTGTKWGIVFTRVEIQELTTDQDISTAMVQQMDAERRRRAMIAEAEGRAAAEIKVAEADKQAQVLRAEGQAQALLTIAAAERKYLEALSQAADQQRAADALIAQKYIDGFDTITQNPADKTFIPNNFAGLFAFDGRRDAGNGAGSSPDGNTSGTSPAGTQPPKSRSHENQHEEITSDTSRDAPRPERSAATESAAPPMHMSVGDVAPSRDRWNAPKEG